MTLRLVALGCFLTLATLCSNHRASAASSEIPAVDYPPHARLTFRALESNHEMDCDWGFLCEEPLLPIMHFRLQDELGRTTGMDQFAVATTLHFALFGSAYGSPAQATGATLDMKAAVTYWGYRPMKAPTGCLAFRGWRAYAMACYLHATEVEGIVGFYGATAGEKDQARRDLAKQISYFLHRG
jgi:hypothetical protein